jgi:hypothetical protein
MVKEFPTKTLVLMQLYVGRLSEKDRRQFAALEALKYGRGGISYISGILGIDRKTIGQGIKELKPDIEGGFLPPGRQRKQGGGRKKNGKKP